MVTHDPRSAEQATRQVCLFDGKLVDDRGGRQAVHGG
jgi:predicted ABC-type transport system involved in lysophospholipase L1 biosynthesis ATPase subunit